MKFHKLDKIMDNVNVHNKYLLTSIVAQRARQIVETRGVSSLQARHPDEKSISLALSDLEEGNVVVQFETETISDVMEQNGIHASPIAETADRRAEKLAAEAETEPVSEEK